MENNWCVYKHTNKVNGKIYVGISNVLPESRWRNGGGYRTNGYFCNSIKKYGWDGFIHEIVLEKLTREEAESEERRLIAEHQSNKFAHGYNRTSGGERNKELSDETRALLSVRLSGEGNPNYGKPRSELTRKRIGDAQRGEKGNMFGKRHRPETLRKMSEARSGENAWCYGKKLSEAHRKALMVKKKKGIGADHYEARKTICLNTGMVFGSITLAAEYYGIKMKTLSNCLRGLYKTSGVDAKTGERLRWEYYQE